ncbi:NAD(P)-dependent dehydrogenase (short-subunit alcohol dehydrogenase family) [Litorivivens lipolytica]|uniref:NAD(P)-dependent dehydrogenase (Short-subunit alcohol dehydrogenase family) n=1 Tax=Litorivivens lipolytica TaxID=1524264 RepID=A0A7W4W5Y9_9GAMM|nr:SDR family oxidoreductase [Litorivivens lipolytica]MBB3047955.1 NAD(P)-dependent dehydrogenase (short-subunit alcohol dehydrogenase family) [Litorivivens lipolytica]
MNSTSEKIAVVTGANRGIGLAVSRQLAEQGIRVLAGCRRPDAADDLKALQSQGLPIEAVALAVDDRGSVAALAKAVEQRFGGLDILINNAGVALDQWQSFFELSADCLRETLETNVIGALHCSQLLVPLIKQRGVGRVVNVSTELASMGEMQMGSTVAYRSSKAALNAMTVLLAKELEKDFPEIWVNAACPGWVKTELGGPDAPRTTDEGADTIVWLATLEERHNGGLFRDRAPYPW